MKQLFHFQNPGARLVVFLASASPAFGHPGHSLPITPSSHPAHWFNEPQHLIGWAGAACLVIAFYKLGRNLGRGPALEKHPKN